MKKSRFFGLHESENIAPTEVFQELRNWGPDIPADFKRKIGDHLGRNLRVSRDTIETELGFTTKNSNFSGIGVVSINNIITDNIIKNNSWFGVYISGVSNDITYNIISNNGLMGIRSELSNQIIIGNEIINNHIGASLCFGSSIVIYHNNISGNDVGIQLIISTDTTIMENNFFNNKESAVFYRGIILEIRAKLRHEIFFKIFFNCYPMSLTYNYLFREISKL